jgi:hypothetical protein
MMREGLKVALRILRTIGLTRLASAVLLAAMFAVGGAAGAEFRSHPPMRPLPVAAQRPMAGGPSYFVDARTGDDANDGSQAAPWRTVQHAVGRLRAGDTLYLRHGIYYEHVTVSAAGTEQRPVTIRSFPGELAIVDGGLREFFESPAEAWEPCPGGADGEYWSTRTYPDLGGSAGDTNLLGSFGDSMIPLQGYRFRGDMQTANMYWNVGDKVGDEASVYCGPGLFFDVSSGRIHVRLAHTTLPGLHEDNYRGETDPRKLRLIVAGFAGGSPLTLRGAKHVRLQDLVVRGARRATLDIQDCRDIELDALTLYGGSTAVLVRDTAGLRVHHTACRGIAAPWTFRGSLKYRAIEARIFSASGWDPTGADNRDFELAYCEFTDCVDGVFVGNVKGVRFHHNLLDNVSDDGIFLTAGTAYDGTPHGGDVLIYQNLLSRCLTTFAFGVGHGRQRTIASGKQMGSGVYIYRNVFDFRRPVMYYWPTGPDAPQELSSLGRVASDHGSPAWEPMSIYHNTILAGDPPRYNYGTDGLSGAMGHGTRRRVFNNIICQTQGMTGETLPAATADYQADGNLLWSVSDGPTFTGEPFAKFRRSPAFEQSKLQYAPGWTANDRFAEPKFVTYGSDWRSPLDLRLRADSPAIDAGVAVPAEWPDPLRPRDAGRPDIGAMPLNIEPWHVGVRGRLTVSGESKPPNSPPSVTSWAFATNHDAPASKPDEKPALVLQGYPAFDAPLIEFALRRAGVRVDSIERSWLDTREYGKYGLVAIDGSFVRAKIEPSKFSADDLSRLQEFLQNGGTLLLMRERTDLFAAPEGQQFLAGLVGNGIREKDIELSVRLPNHPWVKHLAGPSPPEWLNAKGASPLRTSQGESIIGTEAGSTTLYRVRVGKGQLIYFGWTIAQSLPSGRLPSTVEQEDVFEQQMQVLLNLVDDLYPHRR